MTAEPPVFLSKADIARRHIEGLILSGAVKPGDRITTREVSEALGMSETPIREAIRSLASEGWLSVRLHVGAVVESAGSEQLREIYALRGRIGSLAVELGAASYSPARLKEIDANIAASAAAVAARDIPGYTRLNHDFHMLLCDTPHSQWCLRMLVNLSALTSVHHGFAVLPQRMAESLKEHQAIRDAIHAGRIQEAAALIQDHEHAGYEALAIKLAKNAPRGESAA